MLIRPSGARKLLQEGKVKLTIEIDSELRMAATFFRGSWIAMNQDQRAHTQARAPGMSGLTQPQHHLQPTALVPVNRSHHTHDGARSLRRCGKHRHPLDALEGLKYAHEDLCFEGYA